MSTTDSEEQQFIFGFQDQWKSFYDRHKKFFGRFQNLQKLADSVYADTSTKVGREAVVVFVMSRLCYEEFYEILTMAANGYGVGAQKLLRSMYERAVTLIYLSEHPEDINAFIDYFPVAQHKLLAAIQKTFGPDIISKDATEEAERDFQAVKKNYMIPDCEKCGTKRLNHTWHKLDVVSMAYKTPLGKLIVPAYYFPMSHAHSTMRALLSRIEEVDERSMGFNPDPQLKEADSAFISAHNILLTVLGTYIEYFGLKDTFEPSFDVCIQDFKDIWNKNQSASADSQSSDLSTPTL